MSTTLEQPAMVPATDFMPGTESKIQVMAERAGLGQELFSPHDMTFQRAGDVARSRYLETVDDIDSEDERAAAVMCNELIDGHLAGIRSRPTTEASLEPCSTSRDKSLPGCSGRCEWCHVNGMEG